MNTEERIEAREAKPERDQHACGYGLALAELIRAQGVDTASEQLFATYCYSVAQFEAAGLDDYDLEELRKLEATDDGDDDSELQP